MSTLAVSIPSFFVIYGISLFFDQFLSLRWVSCAFHGIQVCVIYLILTAGLKMLKSIDKNTLNLTILTLVVASMLCCSITDVYKRQAHLWQNGMAEARSGIMNEG